LYAISRELYGLKKEPFGTSFNMVEIGGGNSQFARHFLKIDHTRVFVIDITEKFLRLASDGIRKVCCDARYPYFEKSKLDLAIFWLSLHHLTEPDQKKAIVVAVDSL
jgi:ubiquinone/menaquinone biosynthesis C-methylase UbiE